MLIKHWLVAHRYRNSAHCNAGRGEPVVGHIFDQNIVVLQLLADGRIHLGGFG